MIDMSHSPDRDLLHTAIGVGGPHCTCCRPRGAVSSRGARRRRRLAARIAGHLARRRAADLIRRDLLADV